MKSLLKDIMQTFVEEGSVFVKEVMLPMTVVVIAHHYFGIFGAIIAIIASSSIWSIYLTILDAPGKSFRWKLKWFKDPPSPYVIHKTATRAFKISSLIVIAMLLEKFFYG